MNITDAIGIHSFYADRILNIMRSLNATPIVWQDVLDEKVAVSVYDDKKKKQRIQIICIKATVRHNHTSVERCW